MYLLKLPFLILWRILTLGFGRARIREISDRIERAGDRFANARDTGRAGLARNYARRASSAFTPSGAEQIEEAFLVAAGLKAAQSSPVRPVRTEDSYDSRRESYTSERTSRSYDSDSSASTTSSFFDSDSSTPAASQSIAGEGGSFGGGGASGSWDSDAPADQPSTATEQFSDNS